MASFRRSAIALTVAGALLAEAIAPSVALAMPNGLASLRHAVRSPVIAVKSGSAKSTGLIVGVGVVAAGLIISLFTLNAPSSNPAPQQAQAPAQPAQGEQAAAPPSAPSQCWVTTDRERGYGFYRAC